MKRLITLAHGFAALGLWGLCAGAAGAGPNAPLADPANDRAAVPATRYEPLLANFPAPALASSPPDRWKALNRAVASFDSMSLTMNMQGSTPAPPNEHQQQEQQHQHREHK